MGYAMCMGACLTCNKVFSFNPIHVPSFRDKYGVKQPVCEECMTLINNKRKEKGLQPFAILPDAYTYCDEMELS